MIQHRHFSRGLAAAIALLAVACSKTSETVTTTTAPAQAVSSATTASTETPPLENGVYIAHGLCFGEGGCDYKNWRAAESVPVHERLDPASPVIATVQPGEWVQPAEGQLRLIPTRGVVRSAADTPQGRLEVGDVVYMLEPQGEGWYSFWLHGQDISSHWAEGDSDEPITWDPQPTAPSGVITGWWVRIQLANGKSGWVESPRFECMGPIAGDEGCRG